MSAAVTKSTAISHDVFSGEAGLRHHRGGAQAYSGTGGGTEYRDVNGVAGGSGGMFEHHLHSVTSPMGETTRFERGSNGRIERVVYPDGGEKVIVYGADGMPDTVTLPQGTTLTYQHDEALREVSRTSSLGETRSFTYGPNDRIETMTDNTGTTRYEYDSAGRFSGIVYPHGGAVRYVRDNLDRTTQVRVLPTLGATELVTSYSYDANGNLEGIDDPMGGTTAYVYDDVDRLESRTLPNGVVTTYGYDDRDRVLSIEHRNSMGSVLQSVTYERSDSGEPTRITREDGSYVLLTYDAALRLDTETYYDASDTIIDAIDYGYDLDGNRVSKNSLSGGFESYSYSAGFQLDSVTNGANVDSFTYDGGGRVTAIDRDGVSRTLEYNSNDKITRVLDDGAETARYTFDGAGRRVEAVEGGAARRYLVAPTMGSGSDAALAITDSDGTVLERHVFAGEECVMRIRGGHPEYLLGDGLGSVGGVTDASGALTAQADYGAFGALRAGGTATSESGGGFALHGMWLDQATQLYYVQARGYDAATGRFLTRDMVEAATARPEAQNPYAFASQNPLLYSDRSGAFLEYADLRGFAASSAAAQALALTGTAILAVVYLNALRQVTGRSVTVTVQPDGTTDVESDPDPEGKPDTRPQPQPFDDIGTKELKRRRENDDHLLRWVHPNNFAANLGRAQSLAFKDPKGVSVFSYNEGARPGMVISAFQSPPGSRVVAISKNFAESLPNVTVIKTPGDTGHPILDAAHYDLRGVGGSAAKKLAKSSWVVGGN